MLIKLLRVPLTSRESPKQASAEGASSHWWSKIKVSILNWYSREEFRSKTFIPHREVCKHSHYGVQYWFLLPNVILIGELKSRFQFWASNRLNNLVQKPLFPVPEDISLICYCPWWAKVEFQIFNQNPPLNPENSFHEGWLDGQW